MEILMRELDQLRDALLNRRQTVVEQWFQKFGGGRVSAPRDEQYSRLIYLAREWSIGGFRSHVYKLLGR